MAAKETTDLETKLTQLNIAVERTQAILSSGKRVSIKRHLEALQTTAKETNDCKRAVEAVKITNKEERTKIDEWNSEIDSQFEKADEASSQLEKWLVDAERAEKFVAQEEELKHELKMHEKKLQMQAELASKTEVKECEEFIVKPSAKLPKLVLTKFDGSYMNWPKFWGQFSEAIDKSAIAPITKFTYLLELLEPKVKRCIEALPFSPEGYNRAKAILEDKYGKESEIVKCYIKEILDLPQISGANPRKIAEFCEKLTHSVQALETMGKLSQISGNVSMTLDKLSSIRGDLVRTDPDWESWDYVKLVEAIKQWVRRNPATSVDKEREDNSRKRLFQARSEGFRPRGCVYCGDLDHKATQCEKIKDVAERKGILAKRGLCFNCATRTHRASQCTSKTACGNCNQRHHTSICDQKNLKSEKNEKNDNNPSDKKLMTDGQSGEGIFPVVIVNVNNVMCRALIDSGAGSSYASAKLINALKIKPCEIRNQRVDMLLTSQTARMEFYDAKVSSFDGSYEMKVRLTKVEKGELLSMDNPSYDKLIERYQHLEPVRMDDKATKRQLPIHLVLGSGEYARIKTSTKPLVGKDFEPIAEKTKLGWFIMSPGVEIDKQTMLLTQTSQTDFERLCRLDVLGLKDTSESDQGVVYEDFKENLPRNPAGWYETNLPWKPDHPHLPTNETGSRRRLNNLVKKLERNGDYEQYNEIIQDQLEQSIIEPATTKRGALSQLAKIYDPLGLVSPTTLPGKLLYREMCEANLAWDGEFPENLMKRWKDWYDHFPEHYTVPRTLAPHHQPILSINLHAFGDASKQGVAAAVYAVIEQETGTTQGLVCSKSRIAKRNLTIPRLELVAGHMAANLVTNVEEALGRETVTAVHGWLDSTVALYWINGRGEYRQFVSNRVKKIREHERLEWHHVPTDQNPADLGSRGGNVVSNELWKTGPEWLSDRSKWPPRAILEACPEVNQEIKSKSTSQALTTVSTSTDGDVFDGLMEKYSLRKTLRICAWVQRFLHNCRTQPDQRESGPLKWKEMQKRDVWWIKKVQNEATNNPETEAIKRELNLQPNESGILECRGRIDGEYPIYLPRNNTYTQKVVEQAHQNTLHGGVAMTMAKVRDRFWVPKLRCLVKRIRSNCHGCVRFRAQAYQSPPIGNLPTTRTQGTTPFQVLGVDFAGPIRYRAKTKVEKKAYLVLYGCSLTRAVHLEVLKSLEVGEFLPSLKRLIARRGRPKLVYSDNATTFKAAAKWLKQAQKNERLHAFLIDNTIEWRFNLSRAPWWGGQFERLIGLFKRAFYKTIGNGTLTWEELEEVVLDIEIALNNRPLNYLEHDVEMSVLTPNTMLNINPNILPELKAHYLEEQNLRKRAKFLKKCKETMWKRWTREYVRSLRERHRQGKGKQISYPKVGDAVIIQDEERNRNHWKMGIVEELIKGRDGIVRGAKVRTAKGKLERAIQQLYPLELSSEEKWKPNPGAPSFEPRPKRDAAAAATLRIQDQAQMNSDNI